MWKAILIACLLCVCVQANEVAEKGSAKKRTWDPNWSKVGLAWSDWDADNMWALAGNGWNDVAWIYTWSAWNIESAVEADLDFVPMLWGPSFISDFQNAKADGVWDSSTCVLGFNEPDQASQSNLSPAYAATLWLDYIQPLKSSLGLRLGAPAVSSASTGIPWLTSFFANCGGCTFDFIPIHWYGSSITDFTNYVTLVHNTFGLNVWVTEWACVQYSSSDPACDQNSVYSFMGGTAYWLVEQSWVERFSWFGAMTNLGSIPATNALLTSDGQSATQLGIQYVEESE